MKILLIGGTGTISSAITRKLIINKEDIYLLNRGNRNEEFLGKAKFLCADINNEEQVSYLIKDIYFDCVVDFIAYKKRDVKRDYRLFKNKTKQYIFISSASAYQKPLKTNIITENTPLKNPFWKYSRDKIKCEKFLLRKMKKVFPFTIVRPSHTYDERKIPVAVHGNYGGYQVLKRMIEGKPVIIHDDGKSLWTLTHSDDFAKGFIDLIGNSKAINETYHITSDEALSWNQIYELIAKALNAKPKIFYVSSHELAKSKKYDFKGSLLGDKANSLVFDNSKIKDISSNFIVTTSFEKGVKNTVANILNNPELQIEDCDFDLWCDNVIKTGIID